MSVGRRAFLAGGLVTATLAAAGPVMARDVDDAARTFMGLTGAPGMSVALARDGRLRFARAWGRTGPQGERLTPGHRLRIASLSKPVTAAAIMMLAERGALGMQDRIFGPGSWLGETYGPSSPWAQQITVEHLLSHTGGGWTNDGTDPTMRDDGLTRDQMIVGALQGLPLTAQPGTLQRYSNLGYVLLGRVVEQATGEPYESWVRRELLEPCGAGGMRIGARVPGLDESAYVSISGGLPHQHDQRRLGAAGGWIATPTELLRVLARIDGFAGVPDFLHANTTRSMATPPYPGADFGHGWQVDAEDTWWHTGILPGTAAFLCRTAGGYAFAALANLGGPYTDTVEKLQRAAWAMARAQPGWRL
ncbi:MAG TPA: serine hydrolase domain-containing protein [Brevundimonas sp.]|uniref:serine hydrolase domain-containing protein n=1 Tax=Brevundimonas sp. TaxID=1871086 RepID=UPI002DE8A824|nr:serine hydrolase domain-containing protein [Brevundimonas sp.]